MRVPPKEQKWESASESGIVVDVFLEQMLERAVKQGGRIDCDLQALDRRVDLRYETVFRGGRVWREGCDSTRCAYERLMKGRRAK